MKTPRARKRPPDPPLETRRQLREALARNAALERSLRELRQSAAALKKSERLYRHQFETAPVGIGISDARGTVLSLNRAMTQITGYSLKAFEAVKLASTFVDRREHDRLIALLRNEGAVRNFEARLTRKNGTVCDALINTDRVRVAGQSLDYTTVRDVTEQKRAAAHRVKDAEMSVVLLDLYRKAARMPDAEIYDFALEHAVRLTDSAIGFLHLVADDQAFLSQMIWSAGAARVCATPYETPYPIERAGNWMDCVRLRRPVVYNDYPTSPNRQGLPKGHPPLTRIMTAPALEGSKVRLIIGVGNKTEPYDDDDVTRLRLVAGEIHKVLIRKRMETDLRTSEGRYRSLFDNSLVPVLLNKLDGTILEANEAARRLFGLTDAEIARIKARDLTNRTDPRLAAGLEIFSRKGRFRGEMNLLRADGKPVPAEIAIATFKDAQGEPRVCLVVHDLTELKRAERALRESEGRFRALSENSLAGIYTIQDGRLTYVNASAAEMFGYAPDELVGADPLLVVHPDDHDLVGGILRRRLDGGLKGFRYEFRGRCKDGTVKRLEVLGARVEIEGRPASIGNILDVTERRLDEAEAATRLSFLQLIQENAAFAGLVKAATYYLKSRLAVDAVGIRLREGEDFPYFEASGFPEAFVAAERGLCARDEKGGIVRDAAGNPILECLCGDILNGRVDPAKPYFTAGGSFWTNAIAGLRASEGNAFPSSRLRLRCHAAGFESVALVPLRAGGETFGLLQLNDRKPGRFTPREIGFLEEMAGTLAAALAERRAAEAVAESENRFRSLAALAPVGIFLTDAEGKLLYVNPHWTSLSGLTARDSLGEGWVRSVHPEDRDRIRAAWQRTVKSEAPWSEEFRFATPADKITWVHELASPLRDEQGRFRGYIGIDQDITQRLEAASRMRDFSRQILAAREEEKRQIAAALHHDVGSLSVGVSSRLQAVEDDMRAGQADKALTCLADSRKVFEDAMSHLKQLATEMRPPDLDLLGLAAALRQHFAQRTLDSAIQIHYTDNTHGRKIRGPRATALFRIAQEALTNAIRHSGSTRILARLDATPEEILLSLADDGRGFDPGGRPGDGKPHLGLRSMEEMLSSLGGRLEIRTASGQGTEVIARLPSAETAHP